MRYQADRKGAWRFDFADVSYLHAGDEFTVRMPQALGVCADVGPTCDVGKPPGL